jgi:hypothetical protein
MQFEEFGESPEFTNAIQNFMHENASKLEPAKSNGEQSLNNYSLYQKFCELMDKTLEKFLLKLNISAEKFIESCNFAKNENLPCSFLDYVLSTLEFDEFYNLMNDYKKMNNNQNISNEYENIFNQLGLNEDETLKNDNKKQKKKK